MPAASAPSAMDFGREQSSVSRMSSTISMRLNGLTQIKLKHWVAHNLIFAIICAYLFVYSFIGILVYVFVDELTFLDAVYLLLTMVTTVGYGDVVPRSNVAKVFTGVWAVAGLALFTFLIGLRLQKLNTQQQHEENLASILQASEITNNSSRSQRTLAMPEGSSSRQPLRYFLVFSVVLASGMLFMTLFHDHTVVDAFYFCMITGTSVGFGDVSPRADSQGRVQRGGTIFGIVYMVLFVFLVFNVLGVLTTYVRRKARSIHIRNELKKDLTKTMLKVMDVDRSGQVDRAEWLAGLLILHGLAQRSIIDSLLARFDELDVDKDGTLSLDDIVRRSATARVAESDVDASSDFTVVQVRDDEPEPSIMS